MKPGALTNLYVCSCVHRCMWGLYIYMQASMTVHAHTEAGKHPPLLLSTLVFEARSLTEIRAPSLARLAGQSASPDSELQVFATLPSFLCELRFSCVHSKLYLLSHLPRPSNLKRF